MNYLNNSDYRLSPPSAGFFFVTFRDHFFVDHRNDHRYIYSMINQDHHNRESKMALHNLTAAQLRIFKDLLATAEIDHERIDTMASERRDAFDDKSDKYKESENGEAADTLITNIENIRDALDTLKDALNEIEGIND